MKKFYDKLTKTISLIGGLLVLAMTLIGLLQVVMRYIFNSPLTWTEELARYIFVYITFLGASVLLYERSHLFVEIIFNNLKPAVKRIVQLIIDIIVCGFSVFLIFSSRTAMFFQKGSHSTAMHIPMQYIGMSVMIGAILMTIVAVYNIVRDIQNLKGGEEK